MKPKIVYNRIMTVPRDPRFDGDRNPRRANVIVMPTMTKSCEPLPNNTLRSSGFLGVRKTSPCTSFHPESSCIPSSASPLVPERSSRLNESNLLYRAMSFLRARVKIVATMPG